MKNKLLIALLFILFLLPLNVSAKDKVTVNLFYSKTCQHCHNEIEYLKSKYGNDDTVLINYYEKDSYKDLLKDTRKKLNINNSYIPLTIVGTDYVIGFNDSISNEIDAMIEAYQDKDYCDIVSTKKNKKDCISKNDGIYKESEYKTIPLIGSVNVKETSLLLIAIIIGFIDGFNPCAMWVLIFIITLLIEMNDKKKMLILGITFLVSSSLVYLMFMLAWLQVTNSLMSTWFRYIIALFAIIFGSYSIYNYLKTRKQETGCTVTKKEDRKKIMARAKKAISQNKFILAIIGIVALAFSVNLIELACSAGLPTFFIAILNMNNLSGIEYAIYILVYILFFMIDDIVIFLIAVFTFRVNGISNKYTKYSHLIGGIICLIIGILLAFFPNIIMFNF